MWVRRLATLLGARKYDQVLDNLGAAVLALSAEHPMRLDVVSAIPLGFPHEFLASDSIRNIAYGGTFGRIDDHRRG
jgi:hypothetical protein